MGYQFNQGIFIDIFPLDNVCDNKMRLRWQVFQANILSKTIWNCQKYQYGIAINNEKERIVIENIKNEIMELKTFVEKTIH